MPNMGDVLLKKAFYSFLYNHFLGENRVSANRIIVTWQMQAHGFSHCPRTVSPATTASGSCPLSTTSPAFS